MDGRLFRGRALDLAIDPPKQGLSLWSCVFSDQVLSAKFAQKKEFDSLLQFQLSNHRFQYFR
jgi:hypothetical protein